MNREKKFRFHYSDGVNHLFQVYTLEQCLNGEPFEFLSDNTLLKNYKHVGEDLFTGLQDKNGNDIYEGDILDDIEYKGMVVCFGEIVAGKDDWGIEYVFHGWYIVFSDGGKYPITQDGKGYSIGAKDCVIRYKRPIA